jgi:hypothetical protein
MDDFSKAFDPALDFTQTAIDHSYDNLLIRTLFGNILALGNFLNEGSVRGNAQAINPCFFSLLKTQKDNAGEIALRHILEGFDYDAQYHALLQKAQGFNLNEIDGQFQKVYAKLEDKAYAFHLGDKIRQTLTNVKQFSKWLGFQENDNECKSP